jgi:hypothetical protein
VATNLQIEANRRNAQLSTGPKTERGKDASRMNALKHGLTAQQVTLFDERAEDFDAFHAELIGALSPHGTLERALAERAVLCAWRLRRVYRIETGLFRKARKTWGNGTAAHTNEIAVVFLRLASQEDDLSKLIRYEISLERSLQRALRALEYRQAIRGESPLSALRPLTRAPLGA